MNGYLIKIAFSMALKRSNWLIFIQRDAVKWPIRDTIVGARAIAVENMDTVNMVVALYKELFNFGLLVWKQGSVVKPGSGTIFAKEFCAFDIQSRHGRG